MALYSIKENAAEASVTASVLGEGSAIRAAFRTCELSERKDQSTLPELSGSAREGWRLGTRPAQYRARDGGVRPVVSVDVHGVFRQPRRGCCDAARLWASLGSRLDRGTGLSRSGRACETHRPVLRCRRVVAVRMRARSRRVAAKRIQNFAGRGRAPRAASGNLARALVAR